jgi:hypothetical protein
MRVIRDPLKRLELLQEWTRDTAARDRAIRQWPGWVGTGNPPPRGTRAAAAEAARAASAAEARAVVAKADAAIIGYTRSAVRALGYGADDAEVLALIFIPAFTSDSITDELLSGL